jgi:hypothetical protein
MLHAPRFSTGLQHLARSLHYLQPSGSTRIPLFTYPRRPVPPARYHAAYTVLANPYKINKINQTIMPTVRPDAFRAGAPTWDGFHSCSMPFDAAQ